MLPSGIFEGSFIDLHLFRHLLHVVVHLRYGFSLPKIEKCDHLKLHPRVTLRKYRFL